MTRLVRFAGFIIIAVLMATAVPHRSFANCSTWTAINSCNATCSNDCYLLNDQTCTNGQGITLNSGAKLDMCGHSLKCTDHTNGCVSKAAITMSANGSQVINSSTPQGLITDDGDVAVFGYGVQCDHSSTRVIGIKFKYVNTPVRNCSIVANNAFYNFVPLEYGAGSNTDEIHDNYFDNAFGGIAVSNRTQKLTIDHNLFAMASVNLDEIDLSNASNIVANNNVFMGIGDPFAVSSSTLTASANYCDPNGDDNGLNDQCTACVSAGYCVAGETPFTMP